MIYEHKMSSQAPERR